jgi:hypothetical protein
MYNIFTQERNKTLRSLLNEVLDSLNPEIPLTDDYQIELYTDQIKYLIIINNIKQLLDVLGSKPLIKRHSKYIATMLKDVLSNNAMELESRILRATLILELLTLIKNTKEPESEQHSDSTE